MSSIKSFPYTSPYIVCGLIVFLSFDTYASQLSIEGCSDSPIYITPEKSTGLSEIIVVSDLVNTKIKYKTNSPHTFKVYSYSNLGASYRSPIDSYYYDGEYIIIENPIGNIGYIFSDEISEDFFWIIDYSKNEFSPLAVNLINSNNCDETLLEFYGSASPLIYYSINGRQETLSRDIKLSYLSLEFDTSTFQFSEKEIHKNLAFINDRISINPPVLCTTQFSIDGDRFLTYWNKSRSIVSDPYLPVATSVETIAREDNDSDYIESSNQIGNNSEVLGGSAPATISFKSCISDAVVHSEWQIANDELFENLMYRFNQQDLTYTFTSDGIVYVRFIGSNTDGTCESIGEIYVVNIGTSELLIPNAFSPNNDGINDEWKVSYKSILNFQCWIFDRQGHQIFYFNDPNQGWDGKSNGNSISSGVYYYVIIAEGADGKIYKKSGDINLIKSVANKFSVLE